MESTLADHARLELSVHEQLARLFDASAAEQDADKVRALVSDLGAAVEAMKSLKSSALAINHPMKVVPYYLHAVKTFDDLARRTARRPRRPIPAGLSKRFHESLCAVRDAIADYVDALRLHSSKFDPLLPGSYDASNLNELFSLWATRNS